MEKFAKNLLFVGKNLFYQNYYVQQLLLRIL